MTQGPSPPIVDDVSQPIDLSDPSVRARLSPVAIHAFFVIMERWKIGGEDARTLLGDIASESCDELKNQPQRMLDAYTLARISCLLGIYKALNILYSDNLTDEWIRLPNSNPVFGGQSPLAYMIKGGLQAIQTVRKLLDAIKEGT